MSCEISGEFFFQILWDDMAGTTIMGKERIDDGRKVKQRGEKRAGHAFHTCFCVFVFFFCLFVSFVQYSSLFSLCPRKGSLFFSFFFFLGWKGEQEGCLPLSFLY